MRALVAALILSLVLAREAGACSMIPPSIGPFMYPNRALMLATATPDTVFAGPGAVQFTVLPGQANPAAARAIHGQVMRVDSAAGPGSRPGSRAILVAWGYGGDCRPIPSARSARRWREGTYGLYMAQLRDSAHWAGGVPTYDVFVPEYQPYMHRVGGTGSPGQATDSTVIPIEELLSIARNFRVVRTPEDRDTASRAFLDWAAAYPGLASRPPLDGVVMIARREQEEAEERRIDMPVRGTYRITFVLDGSDSATFYGRTMTHIDRRWDGRAWLTRGSEASATVASEGYSAAIWVAPDMQSLAAPMDGSYLSLPFVPTLADRGSRTWEGVIEPNLVRRGLRDAPIGDATLQLSSQVRATFRVGADGSAGFEHRSRLPDGREVIIRGVRVSREVY